MELETLGTALFQRQLVADVLDCEIEMGATAVIAPYLYFTGPNDPRFVINLQLLERTRALLEARRLQFPLVAIVCAQAKAFTSGDATMQAVTAIGETATNAGVDALGFSLSPMGRGDDSYNKIGTLVRACEALADYDFRTWAWRQGIYGDALVAAGLDGYETGIGTREQSDLAGVISRRRPRKTTSKRGGGGAGVYLQPLGRSISAVAARTLLADIRIRAKIMCDDEGCCPNGVASTLDHSREHAVRTRARLLRSIDAVPERRWRLHRISQHAAQAATTIRQANAILAREHASTRLNPENMDALAQVADHLTNDDAGRQARA
jgi:hypothetical protein